MCQKTSICVGLSVHVSIALVIIRYIRKHMINYSQFIYQISGRLEKCPRTVCNFLLDKDEELLEFVLFTAYSIPDNKEVH